MCYNKYRKDSSVDHTVDLPCWPLLVLVEHRLYTRVIQVGTAVEGQGQPEAAVSNLFGPRLLGYLMLQFMVSIHGKASGVSSVDTSPSLSRAAAGVAPSEQPADSLLCVHVCI